MTTEPTEADKAAAKEVIFLFGGFCNANDIREAASVISQHMAPERSAAAAVKAELEEARNALDVLMHRGPPSKEAEDMARSLEKSRKEMELLRAGYEHLNYELPQRGPNGSIAISYKPSPPTS